MAHSKFYGELDDQTSGMKIRRIREQKNITIKDLAEKSQIGKSTIAYYESGALQMSDEKRQAIAEALGVSEYVLKDHSLETAKDIVACLFDMEDAGVIVPMLKGGSIDIHVRIPGVAGAVKLWREQRDRWMIGEISDAAYQEWKDCFLLQYDPEKRPSENESIPEATQEPERYSNEEVRMRMKMMMEYIPMICRDRLELASGAVEAGDKDALALSHLEALQKTIEDICKNELEKLK